MAVPSKRNGRAVMAISALSMLAASVWACGGSSPTATPAPGAENTATVQGAGGDATNVPKVTGVLDRAKALFEAGDYAAAAEAYRAIAAGSSGTVRQQALLGQAVAAFSAGDDAAAVQALQASLEHGRGGDVAGVAQSQFLLGRLLNDLGRFDEALGPLQAAAEASTGSLGPFVLAELQRAAIGAGDVALAAAVGDRISAEPEVPAALVEGVKRRNVAAARESGDLQELASQLEALVPVSGLARDRAELASVYERLGRADDRAAVLTTIVEETPADPQAAAAIDALRADGRVVDLVDAGYVYYRARRYGDAAAALEAALAADPPLDDERRVYALYYLAATTEDRGDPANAIPLYDEVVALDPGSPFAHRARYWAARSTERLEDWDEASTRYVALANSTPRGEFTTEAGFRAGFVLYARGEPAAAAEAWESVTDSSPRVLFWRGVAFAASGQMELAVASFDAAIRAGPLDFYGLEAARAVGASGALDVRYRPRELSREIDWGATATWMATLAPGSPVAAPVTAAPNLVALGLRDEAAAVLLEAAPPGSSAWEILAAAREARELGLGGTAARLAERLRATLGISWQEAPPDLLALAYPLDFPAVLDGEARDAGLDPLFVAALVRTESFWEPGAVSHAGALGLTQVMPATGEAIAAALNVDAFTPSQLLQPSVSLRFGAHYIGEQVARFGDAFVALAAYNGGPSRAAAWKDAWDGGSAASFVEVVDIDETRDYVELVLEAYGRYEYAYGANSGGR